jgi:hypothetical protein
MWLTEQFPLKSEELLPLLDIEEAPRVFQHQVPTGAISGQGKPHRQSGFNYLDDLGTNYYCLIFFHFLFIIVRSLET